MGMKLPITKFEAEPLTLQQNYGCAALIGFITISVLVKRKAEASGDVRCPGCSFQASRRHSFYMRRLGHRFGQIANATPAFAKAE
jgi:hypothetical protein